MNNFICEPCDLISGHIKAVKGQILLILNKKHYAHRGSFYSFGLEIVTLQSNIEDNL